MLGIIILLIWLLIATNGLWWVLFTYYRETVKREVAKLKEEPQK